jgi:hypothetical protein
MSRIHAPTGRAGSTPTGITHPQQVNVVETLTVGGAIVAAPEMLNNLLEAGERLYKYFKTDDPTICQVLDSKFVGQDYEVQFNLTNGSLHGVYLETIALTKPDVRSITVLLPKKAPERTFGFGKSQESAAAAAPPTPSTYKPIYLAASTTLTFGVRFQMPEPGKKRLQSGEFVFSVSQLDQTETRKRKISFLIRTPEN